MLQPTLHGPFPLGSRVKLAASLYGHSDALGTPHQGEVAGISFMHVVFSYIVILDTPMESEYGPMKAISVIGSHLEIIPSVDG